MKILVKWLILIGIFAFFLWGMKAGGQNNSEVTFMFYLCAMPFAITIASYFLFFSHEELSGKLLLKLFAIFVSIPLGFYIILISALSQINK
ncbi:hypothetical protein [Phocoenobacter atlanticus]|uniref:hypothetical protein n=1 Tax=Phocoenobacter atlanticus TaxID=3416742 RepID=UPI00276FC855|nr:hypothetical protein [Pasteurella atlantica]MDP8100783.1 hypothetical protein [Pasteurella atlantica]